ncbi:MAG: glycosyltransferase [Vicinamibacterales bacterium]
MTRTLHFTNAYHPTSGGIRTFYRALLAAAADHQRAIALVVPADRDDEERVGRHGRIYYVQARPAPAFDRRYRTILPDAYLPIRGSRIARILLAERPDLVEICDKYALFYLAAMLRKDWLPSLPRPTLVGLSCERMDDNLRAYLGGSRLGRRFTRWYVRHIYGPPFDYHVANSDYTADELRQCLWDRQADFIQVCPMGVDADWFGARHHDPLLRRSLLERAGGGPASTLLLYAGRLSPEKNVGLLVDALVRLVHPREHGGPDYRLVIAGDGPLRARLAADAAQRAPGRVLMLGSVDSREVLARCYASADVFVHPNPREPFGIAPLEAMASGVPVVLPSAGGVLAYAGSHNAWMATPEPGAFAHAIRAAVDAPDPARLHAARATADAHRWDRIAARYFTLYDELDARFRARTAQPCAEEARPRVPA